MEGTRGKMSRKSKSNIKSKDFEYIGIVLIY